MLYIKLFIEREKNIGQSAPECPFKCCNKTPAVSVINNFRQPHWADNTWFKVKVAKPDTG